MSLKTHHTKFLIAQRQKCNFQTPLYGFPTKQADPGNKSQGSPCTTEKAWKNLSLVYLDFTSGWACRHDGILGMQGCSAHSRSVPQRESTLPDLFIWENDRGPNSPYRVKTASPSLSLPENEDEMRSCKFLQLFCTKLTTKAFLIDCSTNRRKKAGCHTESRFQYFPTGFTSTTTLSSGSRISENLSPQTNKSTYRLWRKKME